MCYSVVVGFAIVDIARAFQSHALVVAQCCTWRARQNLECHLGKPQQAHLSSCLRLRLLFQAVCPTAFSSPLVLPPEDCGIADNFSAAFNVSAQRTILLCSVALLLSLTTGNQVTILCVLLALVAFLLR